MLSILLGFLGVQDLVRICVKSNYPLNIIHSFNLDNTFYYFFCHICMSPDSPVSHMKLAMARRDLNKGPFRTNEND